LGEVPVDTIFWHVSICWASRRWKMGWRWIRKKNGRYWAFLAKMGIVADGAKEGADKVTSAGYL